jgi:uncharacterized protein YbgA (DUF1722 family)
MISEKKKKEQEEQMRKYDEHLKNVLEKLAEAEDAIEDMVEFCSYGEPELYGSKAMKFFFENLRDLNSNGMHFLWEMQDEIAFHRSKKD